MSLTKKINWKSCWLKFSPLPASLNFKKSVQINHYPPCLLLQTAHLKEAMWFFRPVGHVQWEGCPNVECFFWHTPPAGRAAQHLCDSCSETSFSIKLWPGLCHHTANPEKKLIVHKNYQSWKYKLEYLTYIICDTPLLFWDPTPLTQVPSTLLEWNWKTSCKTICHAKKFQ